MTKEELKEKIEAYEEIINDPSEDQTTRDFAAKKVLKLKDQIAPGYAVLSQTADGDGDSQEDGNEGNNANSGEEEIEVEEMEEEEVEEVFGDDDEKFQEEVEEAEPKRTPPGPKAKKKKSTKKKGRGRPKKRGRPAKRKATKKATPTKAKAKKMSKDLGLSVKECEDLLEKYNSEDKARKSRLAKRKKAGKTAELSVSESLEKEVKTVKNKVEDKKTPTTKAQAKSQGSKITDLVKAILEGIDKKKDKITQIDAIIKGLVAEKKKIMAKKGTGAFLVGTALGGYAGYKLGLSKDKTALKDLFKGEKKLAKDFKDAVKDKQKKDETYTEFEEIYAKGGKIDRDEPIVEFLVSTGDREHLSLFRPKDHVIVNDETGKKFKGKDATVKSLREMDEEELVQLMYGEGAYMTDYGVDIGDGTVRVDSIMTMGEFIDRGYAKGGEISEAKLQKMLKDDDVSWSSAKEFFEIAKNRGFDYDYDKETFVSTKTYNEGSYSDKDYAKGGKIVWVGDMPLDIDGREELTKEEAERLAKEWKEKGYDDVIIEDYAKGGKLDKPILEITAYDETLSSVANLLRKHNIKLDDNIELPKKGYGNMRYRGSDEILFYVDLRDFANQNEIAKDFKKMEGKERVYLTYRPYADWVWEDSHIDYAKGGTTYDEIQDEKIYNNLRGINNNFKGIQNLYQKNPSLKMAKGGTLQPKDEGVFALFRNSRETEDNSLPMISVMVGGKWKNVATDDVQAIYNVDGKGDDFEYYVNLEGVDVIEKGEDYEFTFANDEAQNKAYPKRITMFRIYRDDYAKGGTTYDKEQDERIDENQNMSEEGVQLGDDALGLAQENEDKINNIRQGTSKVLNNLYEKNPSLKMAHGGEIEDMSYEELMEVVFEENSSNQNEKLAKEIAKIQEFKYDAVEYADFHLVVRDYLDKSTNKNDDKSREVLLQAFENTGTSYAKGGKTPKFKVRKSFYSDIKDGKEEGEEYGSWTEGINKKTGTGEDKREVYHLKMDDDDYGRNYLLDSGTATEEYLKENAPIGYDKGFYVDEEVYVDFTDKDGNKKKGYMMVNSPDLAVRILRDKYNAVSIEDMLMEWEMEEKGKNFDDYTDSY